MVEGTFGYLHNIFSPIFLDKSKPDFVHLTPVITACQKSWTSSPRTLKLDWSKQIMVVSSFLPNEWFRLEPMRCKGTSAGEALQKFSLLMRRNTELGGCPHIHKTPRTVAAILRLWGESYGRRWVHRLTIIKWTMEMTCFVEDIIEQLNDPGVILTPTGLSYKVIEDLIV